MLGEHAVLGAFKASNSYEDTGEFFLGCSSLVKQLREFLPLFLTLKQAFLFRFQTYEHVRNWIFS